MNNVYFKNIIVGDKVVLKKNFDYFDIEIIEKNDYILPVLKITEDMNNFNVLTKVGNRERKLSKECVDHILRLKNGVWVKMYGRTPKKLNENIFVKLEKIESFKINVPTREISQNVQDKLLANGYKLFEEGVTNYSSRWLLIKNKSIQHYRKNEPLEKNEIKYQDIIGEQDVKESLITELKNHIPEVKKNVNKSNNHQISEPSDYTMSDAKGDIKALSDQIKESIKSRMNANMRLNTLEKRVKSIEQDRNFMLNKTLELKEKCEKIVSDEKSYDLVPENKTNEQKLRELVIKVGISVCGNENMYKTIMSMGEKREINGEYWSGIFVVLRNLNNYIDEYLKG